MFSINSLGLRNPAVEELIYETIAKLLGRKLTVIKQIIRKEMKRFKKYCKVE